MPHHWPSSARCEVARSTSSRAVSTYAKQKRHRDRDTALSRCAAGDGTGPDRPVRLCTTNRQRARGTGYADSAHQPVAKAKPQRSPGARPGFASWHEHDARRADTTSQSGRTDCCPRSGALQRVAASAAPGRSHARIRVCRRLPARRNRFAVRPHYHDALALRGEIRRTLPRRAARYRPAHHRRRRHHHPPAVSWAGPISDCDWWTATWALR